MNVNIYTVDWEEQVMNYVEEIKNDPDASELLLDYILELTQEAYIRGKNSR